MGQPANDPRRRPVKLADATAEICFKLTTNGQVDILCKTAASDKNKSLQVWRYKLHFSNSKHSRYLEGKPNKRVTLGTSKDNDLFSGPPLKYELSLLTNV